MRGSRSTSLWCAIGCATVMAGLGVCSAAAAAGHRPTMSQAVAAMHAGKWKRAAGLLEQITADEPRNAGAWRALGNDDLNMKRFTPALLPLEKAPQFYPDSHRYLFRQRSL